MIVEHLALSLSRVKSAGAKRGALLHEKKEGGSEGAREEGRKGIYLTHLGKLALISMQMRLKQPHPRPVRPGNRQQIIHRLIQKREGGREGARERGIEGRLTLVNLLSF